MKTYNYVRFSSPPQEWGASERRQDDKAVQYCKVHGLPLPEKFIDKGVSAWKGRNRQGALGQLVGILQAGDYLLVEDEDRISREDPLKLGNYLQAIVNRGVTVITLTDGKVITSKNFFESNIFLPMILKGTLAHAENEKKSERILDAWENRRNDILKGKDRFGKLPFWLKRDRNTGQLLRIPEAEAVVKQIFDWADNGVGVRTITARLAESNTPTFRTAKGKPTRWSTSVVHFTLTNPAVFGAFQNYRKIDGKRTPEGSLVEGVLPAVINKDRALLIRDKLSKRKQFNIRGTKLVHNLFSKLAVCKHCGGSIIFSKKGKWGYLLCGRYESNAICHTGFLNYGAFEKAMFRFIQWNPKDYAVLFDKKATEDNGLEKAKAELLETKKRAQRAAKLMVQFDNAEEFVAEYKQHKDREKQLSLQVKELEAEARRQNSIPAEFQSILTSIKSGSFDRIQVREQFRSIIKKMVVDIQKRTWTVQWNSDRPADTLELKQESNGNKTADWYYRFRLGDNPFPSGVWNKL